jgi:hypothetical protein
MNLDNALYGTSMGVLGEAKLGLVGFDDALNWAPRTSLDLGRRWDALILQSGTTTARPSAVKGMIRYNTTTDHFEGYNGAWVNID